MPGVHSGGTLSVKEALLAMQEAVRSGQILQAQQIGHSSVVPLSATTAELNLAGKLSEGAESTVFQGTWQGRAVAVKKVRIAAAADLDRFRAELLMLSCLRHAAVVPLLAAKALPPDYMLVLPLAHANLGHLLHAVGWRPGWEELLQLARQIAAGMAHVHSAGIVHRDLKPANLLAMDPEVSRVCITDFGISVQQQQQQQEAEDEAAEGGSRQGGAGPRGGSGNATGGHDEASVRSHGRPTGGFHKRQMAGTLEYMAPEVLLRSAAPSRASDVYAFAVTLNELATGVVPFSDCTKDNPEVHTVLEMGYGRQELAAAVAAEGLRPLLPRRSPPGFAALLSACWAAQPAARPTFDQILSSLDQILVALTSGEGGAPPAAGAWDPASAAPQQAEAAAAAAAGDVALVKDADSWAGRGNPVVVAEMVVDGPGGGGEAMDVEHSVQGDGDGDGHRTANGNGVCGPEPPTATAAAGWDGVVEACDVDASPVFNAGVFEAIGPRDSMEDRHVVVPHMELLLPLPTPSAAAAHAKAEPQPHGHQHRQLEAHLAAVFDGHRGSQAAEFSARRLPELLQQVVAEGAPSPAAALRDAFVRLDKEFYGRWLHDRQANPHRARGGAHEYPGCTALAALVVGRRLLVANAGDCRAVLCRGGRAVALSRDHTAAVEAERARLQAAGCPVSWQHGGWRVGASGLQVTRCIGDFDVKAGGGGAAGAAASCDGADGAAAGGGVTAEPEVTSLDLQLDDSFLVLASDGLWDMLQTDEAVGLILDTVKEPTMCAKRLAMEALMRGSTDNVTVAVVFLRPETTIERVFAAGREAHSATPTLYGSRVVRTAAQQLSYTHGRAADELRETY